MWLAPPLEAVWELDVEEMALLPPTSERHAQAVADGAVKEWLHRCQVLEREHSLRLQNSGWESSPRVRAPSAGGVCMVSSGAHAPKRLCEL